MTIIKEKILDDLTKDLRRKLVRDINEYLELNQVARLDFDEVSHQIMSVLMDLTASYAAMQFNIEPNEFAKVMGLQFLLATSRQKRHQAMEAEEDGE